MLNYFKIAITGFLLTFFFMPALLQADYKPVKLPPPQIIQGSATDDPSSPIISFGPIEDQTAVPSKEMIRIDGSSEAVAVDCNSLAEQLRNCLKKLAILEGILSRGTKIVCETYKGEKICYFVNLTPDEINSTTSQINSLLSNIAQLESKLLQTDCMDVNQILSLRSEFHY